MSGGARVEGRMAMPAAPAGRGDPAQAWKILVVDDEPLARKKLTHHLRRLGYEVLEAADGAAALSLARQEVPDLMIVDWIMPEVDGPTVCEILKRDPKHRTIQFVLMTAHDKPEQIAEGLARGADDFLSKAATLQETTARVQAGLRTHALVKELETARDTLTQSYQLLAGHQEELEADRRSAADFLRSLLPPPGHWAPGVNLAWQYLPSDVLGGDLFHLAAWNEQELGLFMLDASGHGVGAALRAATLTTLLRTDSLIRHVCGYDPGAIVSEMNRRFPLTPEGDYFTLWAGALHLPTRTLRFCPAGHGGACLIRADGEARRLTRPSLPLGFQADARYASQGVVLGPGDRLYLCSDGLYEVRSPQEETWGLNRLESLLHSLADRPLPESLTSAVEAARAWRQGEPFADDAALLALEVTA